MNGFVKADIRRQVSVCFVGFYLPLNPCAASITITMQIILLWLWYALEQGAKFTGRVISVTPKTSPLIQGGLEIPKVISVQ
ncbi:unnamed protein product [Porites evermanni]|uniref:Uncharacterized protein n=1 Tax=Porites evermanni TaxID=104178 RepID=A0ABN8LJU6_9CNID|nr:unnamed protein product [Porites evermanni]